MPLYDYKCKECSHVFEVKQSFNDEPVSVCPECNGTVERLIGGGIGFMFKGGSSISDSADSCTTCCTGPTCGLN